MEPLFSQFILEMHRDRIGWINPKGGDKPGGSGAIHEDLLPSRLQGGGQNDYHKAFDAGYTRYLEKDNVTTYHHHAGMKATKKRFHKVLDHMQNHILKHSPRAGTPHEYAFELKDHHGNEHNHEFDSIPDAMNHLEKLKNRSR